MGGLQFHEELPSSVFKEMKQATTVLPKRHLEKSEKTLGVCDNLGGLRHTK